MKVVKYPLILEDLSFSKIQMLQGRRKISKIFSDAEAATTSH